VQTFVHSFKLKRSGTMIAIGRGPPA
jgi:hypothetical protein